MTVALEKISPRSASFVLLLTLANKCERDPESLMATPKEKQLMLQQQEHEAHMKIHLLQRAKSGEGLWPGLVSNTPIFYGRNIFQLNSTHRLMYSAEDINKTLPGCTPATTPTKA